MVSADGSAEWLWQDVLVTWSKAAGGGAKGGALAAAIAVPIVAAALLAAAAIGFVLWRRCGVGLGICGMHECGAG